MGRIEKICFDLKDQEATLDFGQKLARLLMRSAEYPTVMFRGPLGAGKTTMIRGIVSGLPGGAEAEVSSPSFNILNIYPTTPETAHFDLYRLEGAGLDPESEDILFEGNRLVLVEWSELLPARLMPEQALVLEIQIKKDHRVVQLSSVGQVQLDLESIG
ncbi:tRNA (adenosine(37)-N6)-threonylcarbamoyltransferase complex ATPase subunit type 1 TsaE [Desulfonatronovibrio hydrogenovorans]|uniref:tRNA (adenosine(37)-N6)-threonylcarbamoyltransferase complex ATPase subunit type 1 TsaE n=1 Tax=Desulfonatronovibrio hydrogenovorans TaxID=53245 RepID=UPI001FC96B03|nr:tRNA (adenosine(37)-N6)-threonylcarbamoyltransferase complex ATPase subunit type 1 TsaE [Desulfonatronovibrio hydrogenovorans]